MIVNDLVLIQKRCQHPFTSYCVRTMELNSNIFRFLGWNWCFLSGWGFLIAKEIGFSFDSCLGRTLTFGFSLKVKIFFQIPFVASWVKLCVDLCSIAVAKLLQLTKQGRLRVDFPFLHCNSFITNADFIDPFSLHSSSSSFASLYCWVILHQQSKSADGTFQKVQNFNCKLQSSQTWNSKTYFP